MEYRIYKLTFSAPVHFGKRSLSDSEYDLGADTIFSALCLEAVKIGDNFLMSFVNASKDGKVLLTDAFPYIANELMIPKPYMLIQTDSKGDSITKKAFKKLKYIRVGELDSFINGTYDVLNAPSIGQLGVSNVKVSAAVRGLKEALPYEVGSFTFSEECGLYLICGFENSENEVMFDKLFEALSYSGLGGKRSSGYGRFTYIKETPDNGLLNRLNNFGERYMSLTTSLPNDVELESAISCAEYTMVKKSGFVSSETYAKEQLRKKDIYMFKAGSCFAKKYSGGIYDVSGGIGAHPVYKYAKPIFVEVN